MVTYNLCNYCLVENCSYEKFSEECQSIRNICTFCADHFQEDDNVFTVTVNDYENITFERVLNLKYCPICGRELQIE